MATALGGHPSDPHSSCPGRCTSPSTPRHDQRAAVVVAHNEKLKAIQAAKRPEMLNSRRQVRRRSVTATPGPCMALAASHAHVAGPDRALSPTSHRPLQYWEENKEQHRALLAARREDELWIDPWKPCGFCPGCRLVRGEGDGPTLGIPTGCGRPGMDEAGIAPCNLGLRVGCLRTTDMWR